MRLVKTPSAAIGMIVANTKQGRKSLKVILFTVEEVILKNVP
jgi:hypothetical protein